MTEDIL